MPFQSQQSVRIKSNGLIGTISRIFPRGDVGLEAAYEMELDGGSVAMCLEEELEAYQPPNQHELALDSALLDELAALSESPLLAVAMEDMLAEVARRPGVQVARAAGPKIAITVIINGRLAIHERGPASVLVIRD